jgi:hypothetical protein
MSFGWSLVRWAGGSEDTVVWMNLEPGVPARCLCGYPFGATANPEPTRLECEGPWRHEWKSLLVELEERIKLRTAEAPEVTPIGNIRDLLASCCSTCEAPAGEPCDPAAHDEHGRR